MKYKAVVFDLDDTLVWDERISRQALMEAAAEASARTGADTGRLAAEAKRVAEELWHAHAPVERCDALGIVAFEGMWGFFHGEDDYLRHLREWVPGFRTEIWRRALAAEGIQDEVLAEELGALFQRRRRELQDPLPGAAVVLHVLREAGLKIGLLTNGAPDLQWEKIEASGLGMLFDAAVVSGELGTGKPDPAIFHHLLEILGVQSGDALMVGNSLSRDIVGGRCAGMATCWLALEGEDEPVGLVEPDFTIRSLAELPPLVLQGTGTGSSSAGT
ncbi:MAG: HAD family hydrolase [Chthoniobacterales bacterium]|nr:HAD family hydrolase [Chthoniobacterales bacterium]